MLMNLNQYSDDMDDSKDSEDMFSDSKGFSDKGEKSELS